MSITLVQFHNVAETLKLDVETEEHVYVKGKKFSCKFYRLKCNIYRKKCKIYRKSVKFTEESIHFTD